jgi:dipeptidyl aminopeptidase/acylaminoacyl peptidase
MRRILPIIACGVIGVVIVLAAISTRPPIPGAVKPSILPTTAPNPLSITAVRQHALTPGQIRTTQTLASRGGCPTSVVSFTSDGLTEYALLQLPATPKPADGYPVLILAHGYITPSAYQTTGSDYESFMDAFCTAGYATIKLDYRGNGSSQGSPTTGDLDSGYTYDLLNLTASLKSLSGINASQVTWLGHSMGGAVVLRGAVASHNLPVKAVVLVSGVVGSLEDIVYGWPPSMLPADLSDLRSQLEALYGTPQKDPSVYHDVSAINYVAAITAPVEINHGTADTVVPLAFSEHLDTALTAAHKPHVFYRYPGGDHQYRLNGSGAAFIKQTLAFLAQYAR